MTAQTTDRKAQTPGSGEPGNLDDLLDRLGLAGTSALRPAALSGGMRQRVALARALANDPRILLMDEPFGALDSQTRQVMQELLLEIWQQRRKTVLFITHDIATVRAIADSIAVMYQGEVVRYGGKTEVLSPPFDDYTDLLLSSVPEMRLGWLEGVIANRKMESGGN